MIDKDKSYKTRDGKEVRIYATDGSEGAPIHGAIEVESNAWWLVAWLKSGHFLGQDNMCEHDLIEVPYGEGLDDE